MRYLDSARTLASYLSRGGESAFVRFEIRVIKRGVSGFSSATTQRETVEAVFVSGERADVATWIIETGSHEFGIAVLLDVHGIAYRYPTGTATAAVVSFPASREEQPNQQVA